MRIVVINNGFVFVTKTYEQVDNTVTLTTARCIRVWGTTGKGLGQLVSGPTSETVLDEMIPVISVPIHQIVFSFDVTNAWLPHLK